jgi:hypothetical protein
LNTSVMKTLLSRTRLGNLIITVICLTSLNGFGQSIDAISLVDVSSGESVQLSNGANPVVSIFFCNSCPYSSYYLDRVKRLSTKFPTVKFVLVNSSPDTFNDKESVEQMKTYSIENGLSIPYLMDKDQALFNALGASKCPEAFLLVNAGSKLEVAYHGAIDDNPQVESQVRSSYLEQAITSVLSGSAIANQSVRPQGCVIKKN